MDSELDLATLDNLGPDESVTKEALATLVAVARAARRYMAEMELEPREDCEPDCVGCGLCAALAPVIDTVGPGGSG